MKYCYNLNKFIMSTLCEYIWIDGFGNLRSKNRNVKTGKISSTNPTPYGIAESLPEWNFDGSSTGQADVKDSEVILKPVYAVNDPFISGISSLLVMCECYNTNGMPHSTNHRTQAKEIFDQYKDTEPWYGIEQEFFLINNETHRPLGFPNSYRFLPQPQKNHYCGVGSGNVGGRDFINYAYEHLLRSGLQVSGVNAEVAPGQWEFQIGPVEGIEAADQVWIMRYILQRASEVYQNGIYYVDFSAKPKFLEKDWNGSGGHTNFSTKKMREDGGLKEIENAISKLKEKHTEHILVYGEDNITRLTGTHETSDYNTFSYGIGSRNTSIRIPSEVGKNGKGYFEDRRPSSSSDPYRVTSILLKTVCSQ